jgi:hypothetical protein
MKVLLKFVSIGYNLFDALVKFSIINIKIKIKNVKQDD